MANKVYKPLLIDSVKAAVDIEQHRFIGFDGNYCPQGAKALGVSDVAIEKEQYVPVALLGILLVEAAGIISVGDAVASDENGKAVGGPAYYIRAAFPNRFGKVLAGFFSAALILALGFMGNMVQSNSISDAMYNAFGVPKIVVGVAVALVAGFIFLGGVQRIVSVTEKLVPVMALLYIGGSLIVLACNWRSLPGVIASIFVAAFDPAAVLGGAAGITVQKAMRFGVARGLFANEAGMGSTPHAHALAKVEKPQDQGITAMIGVFLTTFVILTLTALVILSTGAAASGLTGAALSQYAFATVFGKAGNVFIALCMLFFAFSTIVGWYLFGQMNVKVLLGERAVKPYALLVVMFVAVGACLKVQLVWDAADLFNGLMVLPNLLALLALSKLVVNLERACRADEETTGKPAASACEE